MNKKASKYIADFDYIDKTLIILIILTRLLSATSQGVSIISFPSVTWVSAGIASASFTLLFSLITGITKKILSITGNKKKRHNKILMLAKSKLNSLETPISQEQTRIYRSWN